MRAYRILPAALVVALASCGDSTGGGAESTESSETSGGSTTTATVGSSSGESTDTGTTGAMECLPPVPEDEAADAWAEVICGLGERCGCEDYDPAACHQTVSDGFTEEQAPAMLAGLSYDGVCVQALLDGFAQGDCNLAPPECFPCKIYQGTGAVGEACENFGLLKDDCAEGLDCHFVSGGMCVDPSNPPILQEGDPCFDTETFDLLGLCDFDQGLVCDFDSGTCVVAQEIGQPCTQWNCEPGAWCDELDPNGPTCKARKPDGEPCMGPGECEGDCEDGFCVPTRSAVCLFIDFAVPG